MARGWGGLVELAVAPRPGQQRLLDLAEVPEAVEDRRLHLAAPPGLGKTLVGLELARRRGERALVLVPNAHLVEQWRDEFLRRFKPVVRGVRLEDLVSTDPSAPADLTITTYQSVSVPAREGGPLDALAHEAWSRELAELGRLGDEELDRLVAEDPAAYRRALRERVKNLRRALTRKGAVQVTPLLHPNSRLALAALEAVDVRTVVLDECHHLLDHWALVVIELLERLRQKDAERTLVIGMTATLPDPSGLDQRDRYDALLGPVDVEIPVPAVVVEGGLAPFRELTVELELTPAERELVLDAGAAFRRAAVDVTASEAFRTWLVRQLHDASADNDTYGRWLVEEPELSGAVLRAHRHWSIALPGSLPVPGDAYEEFTDEDLVRLLGRHHRDVLAPAVDPELVELRDELERVCGAFGLQFSAQGLRQGRSPVDQLLSRSEARGAAAAAILHAERQVLGDDLRALVAVSFDRAPSPHALLRGVLDADAGSARRLHRQLVMDERTSMLDPVLVTGNTLRCGNALADELEVALNMELHRAGLDARCWARPVDDRTQQLAGEGPDWSTRHVLPALTRLLDEGRFRCLVATRGLVGQGWDCPSLNVLVDLTQAASAVASPQLHGRTLRLDPRATRKVAHNWDVVVQADGIPGGDADWARRQRRHAHLWTIELDEPPSVARGVRGGDDVVVRLDEVERVAKERDEVRDAWTKVTPPQRGEVVAEVVVEHAESVHGGGRPWELRGPTGWVPPFAGVCIGAAAAVGTAGLAVPLAAAAAAGVGAGGFAWAVGTMAHREEPRRLLARLPRAGRADQAGDRLDVDRAARLVVFLARAVRDGLVAAELVPRRALGCGVRLERRHGELVVRFEDPTEGAPLTTSTHEVLATSVAEVLGGGLALRDQRYALVVNLHPGTRALPCPTAAGETNARATAFAKAFGKALHLEVTPEFLRSPTGRQLLLDALADAPVPFGAASRHVWA